MINARIAQIDHLLSIQLNEILHAEEFQKLEASWRGLKFVIDRVNFRENIKVEMLNVSKEDLLMDFEDSPEIPKSGLYKIVYSAEVSLSVSPIYPLNHLAGIACEMRDRFPHTDAIGYVFGRDGLAAFGANDLGVEGATASLVRKQERRAGGGHVVAVAPFHQHQQDRIIFDTLAGQAIFVPADSFGGDRADHADRFQPVESLGEDIGSDAAIRADRLEPRADRSRHDQEVESVASQPGHNATLTQLAHSRLLPRSEPPSSASAT